MLYEACSETMLGPPIFLVVISIQVAVPATNMVAMIFFFRNDACLPVASFRLGLL